MVRSLENGVSLPPFLVKCYEMVSDELTNDLISWSESNDSFVIWDETKFSNQLLPKYFKHGNFSSFVRQLNIYGFRKIDTDHWQFANEAFIKGKKHLLKNITRRKHLQNPTPKKPVKVELDVAPATQLSEEEDKRAALWKEVENLKTDKSTLMQELKNLTQHQQNSQDKLSHLRQQLNGMEKNQQQMLSFIVMVMQSPEFMVQFFQTMENGWRLAENGSSKLSEVTEEDCGPVPSTDGIIVAYQPPKDGAPIPSETTSYVDDFMDFDFSSEELRDLLIDIDFTVTTKDDRLPHSLDNLELSFNNSGQFSAPNVAVNDIMLDQLLLSDPSREEKQADGFEDDPLGDSETQIRATNTSEKLEGLTKKLEDLL